MYIYNYLRCSSRAMGWQLIKYERCTHSGDNCHYITRCCRFQMCRSIWQSDEFHILAITAVISRGVVGANVRSVRQSDDFLNILAIIGANGSIDATKRRISYSGDNCRYITRCCRWKCVDRCDKRWVSHGGVMLCLAPYKQSRISCIVLPLISLNTHAT